MTSDIVCRIGGNYQPWRSERTGTGRVGVRGRVKRASGDRMSAVGQSLKPRDSILILRVDLIAVLVDRWRQVAALFSGQK